MSDNTESVEHRDNPYFGLDYYEEKYGAWFFGREIEGSKIITNLRAARLTLLHAESGVGKSSLLHAGVAWRMRKLANESLARRGSARSIPIVFSSWKDDPVLELTGAVRTAIRPYLGGRPEPELPDDRLDTALSTASNAVNASLLIMLDQFEEYFLYRSREPTPEQFADELARCINRTDLRANFLIAIREDAYAGLGDLFKGRIANVYSNYLHVDYLDRAAAEKAIREPLDIYNRQPDVPQHVKIQDELVDAVLDQVRAFGGDGDAAEVRGAAADGGGGSRVATPLLQLVMETVWQRERTHGSDELRLSTLQDLRGVRIIVDAHLGKALDALSSGERQTALDMFDHLVTPSGGKIAESVPDLAKRTGHNEARVGSVLDKLDHERIVRPIPAAPGQDPMRYRRYEIFHDVLAPTINRAIAAREERRRVRRLRRFAVLAAGLLVVATALVVGFAILLRSANTEKLVAESRELAADADLNATSNPELSALLALQALHLHRTSQAGEALRTSLPAIQAVRTFQDGATVFSAAFDPANPNLIASADLRGIAGIWNVKSGRRLLRMSLGGVDVTGSADAVAFNASGSEVAVGYGDGQVVMFRAANGRKVASATIAHSGLINTFTFIGRSDALAIATQNGFAIWKPHRLNVVLSHKPASTVAVNPHNPLKFAVVTDNHTVIWNISRAGETQRSLPQGSWSTNDAVFSPDGKEVVTANNDGSVRVYDLSTFQSVMTLNAGEADATSVAFSPDGSQIAAGYSSGRVRVWDVHTRLQLTLLAGNVSNVYETQFNANDSEIVTASDDGTIRVWYSRPRELRAEFANAQVGGAPNPVTGAMFSSNGRRVLSLDNSRHIYVSSADGTQQAVINAAASVNSASWNSSATEIVSAESDGTVDLWHATGSHYRRIALPSPIHFSDGAANSVDMSSDGSRIAILTHSFYTVQVRSGQTGHLLHALNPPHAVFAVVISPDGRQILAGDIKGQVEVWNAVTGKMIRLLGKPGEAINALAYNKSGSEFVAASANGVVTVWSTRSDRRLHEIDACPSPNTVSLSPDDSKIVIACADGTVPVFDAAIGQQLTALPATSIGTVNSAAFSPDGNSIVTAVEAEGTGGVQIWSSDLAIPSLSAVERIAEQRVTRQLMPSERRQYLIGLSG